MVSSYRGRRIYVERKGAGPPLVFLHGIGADADTFVDLGEQLQSTFTVLAWDAPGYHRSDDPEGALAPREYGEAALQVVRAAGFERAVLVGHSFGGLVALESLGAEPERVAGLVLIDPSLGHRRAAEKVRDGALRRRIEAIEGLGPEEMARRRTPELLSPTASPAVREAVETVMRRVRAPGYVSAARAIHAGDARCHLERTMTPLLVVWGEADQVTPITGLDQIRAVRPDASVLIVPGAGHLPYLEDPALVRDAISRFARLVYGLA